MIIYSTDLYDVRLNKGREQPFTIWNKKDRCVEFFAFTRAGALDYVEVPTNT